mmetsp:Transcript_94550/g.305275  ORF Transcript_94550/g.305275 Transcript_94550/m.305275 type:complete len:176 (+) Transcript_94550:66-593(+)
MAGVQVSVKFAKGTTDIQFEDAAATIGELREAIEKQLSVPRGVQTLICAGKTWKGIAFSDELKLLEAAGPKGVKEVMGVKVLSVMLMAPAGADGGDDISRCQAQVEEAKVMLAALEPGDSDALRKALLLIDDLLTKAAQGLDNATLVGAQRERRRELLREIEALGEDVASRKSNL